MLDGRLRRGIKHEDGGSFDPFWLMETSKEPLDADASLIWEHVAADIVVTLSVLQDRDSYHQVHGLKLPILVNLDHIKKNVRLVAAFDHELKALVDSAVSTA